MAEVLSSVLRDDPPPLQTTPALQQIVRKCLAKRPADRFQSVSDLKTALEQATAPGAQRQPSIAVLPFANMSGDKEQEYFSDGLTEDIINALAQMPELKVTARTSAFSFKGKDVRVSQIARELGVDHILEGSVRKAGSRVRITAQLIGAADGFHLWSDRYDRELTDVFAVQDEISGFIAAVLKAKLVNVREGGRGYTPKIAAYEAYLKARHYQWTATSPESLEKSRACYEEATLLDPGFALPHAMLAESITSLRPFSSIPRKVLLWGAGQHKGVAARSILARSACLARHLCGVGGFRLEGSSATFRSGSFQSADLCIPSHLYGYFYLRKVGRAMESVHHHRRAIEEDPLNLIIRVGLAVSLTSAGQEEEAATEARKILELDPNFVAAYTLQALDVTKVPLAEALAFAERGHILAPWNPISTAVLAGLLVRAGEQTRAAELIGDLGDGDGNATPAALAIFHLLCGDVEKAAEWTEKALDQRHNMVAMLLLAPPWKPLLRTSARWPKLARIMNLPVSEQ